MFQGGNLIAHFSIVEDPRFDRNKKHPLINIIIIAICAVLCGADDWMDIADFGEAKKEWFKTFLTLPNGIPSHDTFGRVFAMLSASEFEKGFASWISSISQLLKEEVVAIDGKTIRRSGSKKIGQRAIHMVSAFARMNGLTLGQVAIDEKSNELKAIPKLLKILNVSECIVTIDAAGCYREVVQSIVQKQADYLIAVKHNQPKLFQDIEKLFTQVHKDDLSYASTQDKGHGREEKRECWVISQDVLLDQIHERDSWNNLHSIAMVTNTRTVEEKTSVQTRFYISSLTSANAQKILSCVRDHWSIENSLHWILDVSFSEDQSRIRKGYAQNNFNLLRKIALGLLKKETTKKVGIKGKRLNAGWDENYLLKILGI